MSERTNDAAGAVDALRECYTGLRTNLARVIVGQEQVVKQLATGLISGGHMLMIGVPGLAKTLMVRALAETLGWKFHRIQFTPDLMPADITGTEILQQDESGQRRSLMFHRGPIFANLILADEINRTPPKTQAALLEAMQEHAVTVSGTSRRARTRCRRRSLTGSCSRSTSSIRPGTRSWRSPPDRRGCRCRRWTAWPSRGPSPDSWT